MEKNKVKVCRFGVMERCMRVVGKTVRQMAKVDLFTLMATFTKEVGLMTRQTDMESTSIKTEHGMKETGKMISIMALEKRFGPMEPLTKALMRME